VKHLARLAIGGIILGLLIWAVAYHFSIVEYTLMGTALIAFAYATGYTFIA